MDPRILYAGITIILGLVIAGIAHVLVRWLKKKAAETESQLDDILLAAVGKPLVITILVGSIYIALTRYGILPETVGGFAVYLWVNAFFIVIGAWIASVFLYSLLKTYGSVVQERADTDFDDRLLPLLLLITKYLIWFIALLLILANFHIDITPLLAGAGIAGIALALAAQDILGNFFGGAIITMDKPFKIGDRVRIDAYFGDIVNIGSRSTRLKTPDNQIVTIPNSKITSNIVVNYAQPDIKMKVKIPFSVAYGTDIPRVKQILLAIAREAAENTTWVLSDPAPLVYFLEFGESNLNGQIVLWMNNYDTTPDVQDYINSRIDEQFRKEGITIPFRQVDVWLRRPEGP
jgi:MscS family membrane protein